MRKKFLAMYEESGFSEKNATNTSKERNLYKEFQMYNKQRFKLLIGRLQISLFIQK